MKNARLSWHWFAISLVLLMSLAATASAQSTWDA
ncbi:MAG: amino acid ABC transporter, partial [Firmicutes bacterium]|nr:amino acid ABC transporter [Bacillota bacterium]